MPVEPLSTQATLGSPLALRHIGLSTRLRPRPNLDALPLPHPIVPMVRPNQGVRNLVQNGVLNLLPGVVSINEVNGQLNSPTGVHAEPHGLFPTIEAKVPVAEPVLGHQLNREFLGLLSTLRF